MNNKFDDSKKIMIQQKFTKSNAYIEIKEKNIDNF